MKLFISYSRDDAGDFAKHIHRYLRDKGHAVFIDVNNIRIGEPWADSIEKNISESDIFVVILTPDSLMSNHVEREVLQAQKQNKIIVPCINEDVEYSEIKWGLEKVQGIEFSDEYKLTRKLYSKIKNYTNKENEKPSSILQQNTIQDTNISEDVDAFDKRKKAKERLNKKSEDLKKNKQINNWSEQGDVYFKQKKYTQALEYYDKVLRIDPNNESIRYNRFLAIQNLSKEKQKDDISPKIIQKSKISTDISTLTVKENIDSYRSNRKTKSTEIYHKGVIICGSEGSKDWEFKSPKGMTVTHKGIIYLADSSNNRIQKFDSDGKYITKWGKFKEIESNELYGIDLRDRLGNWKSARFSDGKFNNPSGIAIDYDDVNLYVCDTNNHRIQKFDSDGKFVTKWGSYGSKDGQFNNPSRIAVDSNGCIYVIDNDNSRIQKFDSDGTYVWTYTSYEPPRLIGIDLYGNAFIWYKNKIQNFDSDGTLVIELVLGGSKDGQFNLPSSIAGDSQGNVYVADKGNHQIQKFDSDGRFVKNFTNFDSEESAVTKLKIPGLRVIGLSQRDLHITVDSKGYVYVVESYGPFGDSGTRIQKLDSDGRFVKNFTNFDSEESAVTKLKSHGSRVRRSKNLAGIAVDSKGYVYVVESNRSSLSQIHKFDSNGKFVTKWGSYGSKDGQFNNPSGIAIDSKGYVYVADRGNHRILKFDSNGKFVTKWIDGQFNNPSMITIDCKGDMYVVDLDNHRIQKFDSNGKYTIQPNFYHSYQNKFFAKTFCKISDIVSNSSDNLFITDIFFHCVYKFDHNWKYVTKWGSYGSKDGQFNNPSGIAVDSKGYVYIADRDNHRIQKFDSNGKYVTKWAYNFNIDDKSFCPELISVDNNGNVYVSNSIGSQIIKFYPER